MIALRQTLCRYFDVFKADRFAGRDSQGDSLAGAWVIVPKIFHTEDIHRRHFHRGDDGRRIVRDILGIHVIGAIAEQMIAGQQILGHSDKVYIAVSIGRDRYPLPAANRHLLAGTSADALMPDDFCHELALYADGLLFTGCAHSGLENILASVPDLPLHTVLGGFHLLDGYENEEELLRIANHLKAAYPGVHFYTSHCTGDAALQTLQQVLGAQIQGFFVGQHTLYTNLV